jgi:hypothetical protein
MNRDWIRGLGGVPRTGSTELLDDELIVCDAIFSVPTVLGMILGGEFGESFNLPYDLTNEGAMEELVEGMEKRNILERKGELGKLGPLVVLTVKGGELWERERKPVWEAFFQPRFSSPGVHKRTFRISALRQDILICLGSSDQSKLESCRSDLVVGYHVLRSEFGRCQIAEA